MASVPETAREPCPDRILDDIGGAFAMGSIGGSVFHFIKGSHLSPRGERIAGGMQAIRMNAPRIGGGFAVWGGLYSTCDCSLVYLRQKEDPWNSIMSGAFTGGFLSLRHGLKMSARSAAVGGVLLACIEGVGILMNKYASIEMERQRAEQMMEMQRMQNDPRQVNMNMNLNIPNAGGVNVATLGGEGDSGISSAVASWFKWGSKEDAESKEKSQSSEVVFEGNTPIPSFELK